MYIRKVGFIVYTLKTIKSKGEKMKNNINICGISYEVKLVDGDYCGQNMGKSDLTS